jgi:hypothetical protein
MAMFTICTAIIPEGELEKQIIAFREAEKRFTREIGVLQRDFYQCVQQPHIIWSNTKWTSEKAHNDAAESIMKVRRDDRIGSAYFQPGLYFEVFCNEINEASYEARDKQPAGLIVVSHGLVALKQLEHWNETVRSMSKDLPSVEQLRFCRVFHNYYNATEFIGFMGWNSLEDYQEHRMIDDLTVEERVYTGLKKGYSLLAAYNQFQCNPLKVK